MIRLKRKGAKIVFNLIFCTFFVLMFYLFALDITGNLPTEYNIQIGDNHVLNSKFPLFISYDSGSKTVVEFSKLEMESFNPLKLTSAIQLKTLDKGTASLHYKVFGFIPYRTVKVNVIPKLKVNPGGHSIGVKLNTDGVLIVGIAEIVDPDGVKHNLAEQNGVRIGDTVIAINGTKVENSVHVAELIQGSNGNPIELTLKRNGNEFKVSIAPVKSEKDNQFKFGFWVRDKTAGVGTLTFYEPITKKFGALGHAITDIDTGALLSIKNGEMMKSRVVSIQEGKKGRPGEIRGVFSDLNKPIGRLEKNTQYGVYGETIREIEDSIFDQPIEIAYQHEIKEGTATILTTLDDNTIAEYDIEIVKVNHQTKPDGKSMIIRITDKRLLEKTGGIVQGMSGSPILQNNKIVGAVTHVLINDPTRGYGIFIEWMLVESGIYDKLIQ